LVKVASPKVRIQPVDVDIDHPGGVSSVNQDQDPFILEFLHEPGNRKDEARRRCNMVHNGQTGLARRPCENRVHKLVRPMARQGNWASYQPSTPFAADSFRGIPNSPIGLVGGKNLGPGRDESTSKDSIVDSSSVRAKK